MINIYTRLALHTPKTEKNIFSGSRKLKISIFTPDFNGKPKNFSVFEAFKLQISGVRISGSQVSAFGFPREVLGQYFPPDLGQKVIFIPTTAPHKHHITHHYSPKMFQNTPLNNGNFENCPIVGK